MAIRSGLGGGAENVFDEVKTQSVGSVSKSQQNNQYRRAIHVVY